VAVAILVLAVLVAGGIMYRVYTAPVPMAEDGGTGEMGMESGMMGSGGGPGGMQRPPSAHRELGAFVAKLSMWSQQEGNEFTAEQKAKLVPALTALAKAEAMSTEEAESNQAALAALLTEEQRTAVEAIELPRRGRGGPRPPEGEAAAAGGQAPPPPPAGGMGGGGSGDWRAAMRARMLEVPYVKDLYDKAAAADPEFATSEEKQSEFFRGLRDTLSPFLRGRSQEALQTLIADLSPTE
jgi:hypothetical protein